MDFLKRAAGEGFIAGCIGAGGVATWFLVVDTINGRPFFTPAMLGSALFLGLHDPTAVQVAFPTIIMYTMVHVLAFWVVGTIAAMLAALVDKVPATLFLIVVFFAVFEVGFYILVATIAQPLLGALAWTNVAIGNLLAAAGMGYYLLKVHPHIREAMAAHPLGETEEGE